MKKKRDVIYLVYMRLVFEDVPSIDLRDRYQRRAEAKQAIDIHLQQLYGTKPNYFIKKFVSVE